MAGLLIYLNVSTFYLITFFENICNYLFVEPQNTKILCCPISRGAEGSCLSKQSRWKRCVRRTCVRRVLQIRPEFHISTEILHYCSCSLRSNNILLVPFRTLNLVLMLCSVFLKQHLSSCDSSFSQNNLVIFLVYNTLEGKRMVDHVTKCTHCKLLNNLHQRRHWIMQETSQAKSF